MYDDVETINLSETETHDTTTNGPEPWRTGSKIPRKANRNGDNCIQREVYNILKFWSQIVDHIIKKMQM